MRLASSPLQSVAVCCSLRATQLVRGNVFNLESSAVRCSVLQCVHHSAHLWECVSSLNVFCPVSFAARALFCMALCAKEPVAKRA